MPIQPPKRPQTSAASVASSEELEAELARRLAPSVAPLGEAVVGPDSERVFAKVGSRLESPWVTGDLRFGFPVQTWDAWMVLGALAGEPLARNRDGSLPQKWLKPLADRLVPVPNWWGLGSHPEQRVLAAIANLDALGALARQRGDLTSWNRIAISTRGSLLQRGGRVDFFRDVVESGRIKVFDLSSDAMSQGLARAIEDSFWLLENHKADDPGVGRLVKRRVLESLPESGAAYLRDVVEAFGPRDPWIPEPNARWAERRIAVAQEQFLDRIHPVQSERILAYAITEAYLHGLMFRGVASDGSVTVGLTEAGRRRLGLGAGLGAPTTPHAKVTAAYDVVFGRVDPSALAELGLYAELTGTDHGLVGRLTRAGCQRAFALGISLSEVVASLGTMAAHVLPKNVLTSLEDWARAAQPVRVRDGVLMQCPDEETALSIERIGKGAVERIGPSEVFLADRKALGALRKKAAAVGILI
ncbi:MAG TPA: hypothetical protein PKY05_04100 [Fibrobacteria bacterium]|nr:hypothetical protein [Fibrobacteria bacterium]